MQVNTVQTMPHAEFERDWLIGGEMAGGRSWRKSPSPWEENPPVGGPLCLRPHHGGPWFTVGVKLGCSRVALGLCGWVEGV